MLPDSKEPFLMPPGTFHRWRLSIWIQVFRPFTYTASVIPVCCGAALAASEPKAEWMLLPLVLAASLSVHAAANLINEYFDFKKGVDRPGTYGGSRVLPEGLLNPRAVLIAGYVCFALTALIGLVFVHLRGWPILALGLLGIAGGFFYTAAPIACKYRGLGDPMVFCLMGPLMVIGAFYVLTGTVRWAALLISLPIGSLVAAILSANNLRDIADDTQAGIQTTASLLGRRWAQREYAALVLSAYLVLIGLVLLRILPLWSLLVLLTVPFAVKNIRSAMTAPPDQPQQIATLDQQTAALHLTFGVLLTISLLLGK
jgi:1,4-dihydroxy-2-naphthoate octaprenyltransferase